MTLHSSLTDALRDTILAYVLGTLSAEETHSFTVHLETSCRVCAQELRSVEQTLGLLGHTTPAVRPHSQLRARLFATIRSEVSSTSVLPPPESGNTADFFLMRASDGDWRPFSPGVQVKLLFTDPQTRRITALVRMEPGTHLPRHQHLMVEELFVLEGDCHIASDQVLHAGDYFRAEGGSIHGTTYTEAGTTFLTLCLNDFSA